MRRQLAGAGEIEAALRAGEPVRLVLVHRERRDAWKGIEQLAREHGVRVRETSGNDLRRMSRVEPPADVLALVGPDPTASLDETLAADGAVWLLVDVIYPGNAGYAIRTAEVSGSAGIVLDCALDGTSRRQALRTSMHADRFFPVHWAAADATLRAARHAGRRALAIEDVGDRAPWSEDLTGPVLLVVGGEERGVPDAVLAECDAVLRIPMHGFVPAYNLQAAMAAVAAERLRQEELS